MRYCTAPDLDLALFWVVAEVPRRADDTAVLLVDGDQCAAGLHRLAEEDLEDLLLVPIAVGVLFPDERVRRNRVEGRVVLLAERPEFEQVALLECSTPRGVTEFGTAGNRHVRSFPQVLNASRRH